MRAVDLLRNRLHRAGRIVLSLALVLALAPAAANSSTVAERTRVKPGFNLFSPKDDIDLGRKAAGDAEKQLPLLRDKLTDNYLTDLGKRLARHAPGHKYPYEFKGINQGAINAFALPGGPIFINRGTIEQAENEAQLAGVMAHEIAHVALRHGTNQVSKAYLVQVPLAFLGGSLGNKGIVGAIIQVGGGFGFNAMFMKFSRSAETQADILGAQMLYDAGYDPREMAKFFDHLAKQSRGRNRGLVEGWFSSHPNPKNRESRINEEMRRMGGVPENARTDSENFHLIREHLREMPAPPKPGSKSASRDRGKDRERYERPSLPSRELVRYRHRDFSIRRPENWEVFEQDSGVTIAPREGIYGTGQEEAVGYGLIIGLETLPNRDTDLRDATDDLIRRFKQSNPGMREQSRRGTRVAGQRAYVVRLESDSPLPSERESDWTFILKRDDRVMYLIFVVPLSEERAYRSTFQQMLDSLRLQ